MVSYRTVYDCRRSSNANADAGAFPDTNADLYDHADQSTYRDAYDFAYACSNTHGDSQFNEDDHTYPDAQPHTAADFNDAAFAHAARHGYPLAQPDETSRNERALMGVSY